MELIQKLQAMLGGGYSVAVAVAAIFAVLFKMFGHVIRALEWHDKYFVRKRLARIRAIRPSASQNQPLADYLNEAVDLEVFRIASGINTSKAKMEYLLQLSKTGRWSREQLRSLSKFLYLEPGATVPELVITGVDRFGAFAGCVAAFGTLFAAALQLVQLILTGNPLMWLLGIGLFGLAILVGRFLATDLIDVMIASRAKEHLNPTKKRK